MSSAINSQPSTSDGRTGFARKVYKGSITCYNCKKRVIKAINATIHHPNALYAVSQVT